jgi:uncharacterized membrane protein YphA (DoxX/SURF4 family)
MQNANTIHKLLNYLIAIVWLLNGLFCKLLNLVPRHQLIVSKILGANHAVFFTKTIGVAEVLMTIWILSGFKPRLCAIIQIVVVLAMNIIEFTIADDLLLFGRINLLIAIIFVLVIYCNEFVLNKTTLVK